jgi:cyclopropane-fatty-acyl-phospholipid synthase
MKPNDLPSMRLPAAVAAPAVPRSARLLLALLDCLSAGRLELTTPDGRMRVFEGRTPGPQAHLRIHDWSACAAVLRSGDIGFAESFKAGHWDTPDLAGLLTLAAVNHAALGRAIYGRWWGWALYRIRHLQRTNSRAQAKRNIHAHYDLGNDFYGLWLDPSMTYSAALFDGQPELTLEQAQLRKYERIVQQLGLRPGARVLEIGCGWGGFAEHAAGAHGLNVHGITLSARQLEWARERIGRAGLSGRATFELRDYRDLRGRFDAIVSIEMFEAVGERYWPSYFRTLRERLQPGGRALVQTITIEEGLFNRYRRGTDFIQQYIFPGGMLPSPRAFRDHAAREGMSIGEVKAFGPDYAETLRRWRSTFNARASDLRALGFDEQFARLWNFYLAYCEGGFRAGTIDVVQAEVVHA